MMLHNINMVKYNLNYASNELSLAISNLNNFVNISARSLNGSKANDTKSKIDNQVYILNKYIIPAVKKM